MGNHQVGQIPMAPKSHNGRPNRYDRNTSQNRQVKEKQADQRSFRVKK